MAKTVEELTREKEILEAQASLQRTIYENDNRRTTALKESLALEEKILLLEDKIYKRSADGIADQISLQKQIDSLTEGFTGKIIEQIGLQNQVKTLQELKARGTEEEVKNASKVTDIILKTVDGTLDLEALTRLSGENFGELNPIIEQLLKTLKKTPDFGKKVGINKQLMDGVDDLIGGFYSVGKAAYAATGPIGVIVAGILALASYLIGVAKQTLEVRRELGLSAGNAIRLSFHMEKAAAQTKLMGGDAQVAKDLTKALATEFGTVGEATSLSSTNIARLATHLGVGGSESAKLLKAFSDISGESLNNLSNTLMFEASLAKSAGIPVAKVMGQVASNTALFARYGADGANQLFRAARAAADLGTSLDVVEGVADKILDLESSIAAELEAEMLIGRDINLDRARQLAQANDLEGLQQEIVNQVGGPEAFANLGRIEQGALASAFGLSVEQIKPFLSGEKTGGVGDPQTAAIQQMNKELGIAIKSLENAVIQSGGDTTKAVNNATKDGS